MAQESLSASHRVSATKWNEQQWVVNEGRQATNTFRTSADGRRTTHRLQEKQSRMYLTINHEVKERVQLKVNCGGKRRVSVSRLKCIWETQKKKTTKRNQQGRRHRKKSLNSNHDADGETIMMTITITITMICFQSQIKHIPLPVLCSSWCSILTRVRATFNHLYEINRADIVRR